MKKILFILTGVMLGIQLNAQPIAGNILDINNIKARANADGSLFWDFTNAQFEAPKGSGKNTIFADGLWIGGYDPGMQLKVAGQTYRQNGTDFWPGAVNSSGIADSAINAPLNKVWKIKKCDIDLYRNWCANGQLGACPVDSLAQHTIINWPVLSPYGSPLAPYYDVNVDGHYDPLGCDYPVIKGDEALFFVYNDVQGIHTETGGSRLRAEIHVMMYAYDCPDSALQNAIFVSYKIVNRSPFPLHDIYIGKWTDFDIGGGGDDYVGCDVSRGAYFGYNADNNDAGAAGYGAHPAAQGVVFLKGPLADINGIDDLVDSTVSGSGFNDGVTDNERLGMSKFIYYENNAHPIKGNPTTPLNFYNYLSGKWRDGSPWVYGGDGTGTGTNTDFMFPGTSDPLGYGTGGTVMPDWTELTSGNLPGDRRGVGATGPFTVQQGALQELEIAYVFGRDYTTTGNLAGLASMNERIDTIRARYAAGGGTITGCGCAVGTGVHEASAENPALIIYPNPAAELLHVDYAFSSKNGSYKIYDATGSLVKKGQSAATQFTVNVNDLTKGLYILMINDNGKMIPKKFLKE